MIVNYIIFTVYVRLLTQKLVYGCYFDGGELQQTLDKGTLGYIPIIPLFNKTINKADTFFCLITPLDIQSVCKSTNDEYLDRGL